MDANIDAAVVAPGGEDPPPFTPYEASYFTSGNGNVVSHDPHLNEDGASLHLQSNHSHSSPGEALHRFLLSQACIPPQIILHCSGSHDESRVHTVPRGIQRTEREEYTETVVDFDFKIDVGQHIVGGPTHWSVADSVPTYRGHMFREVGVDDERRKATKSETKAAKSWEDDRARRGFPPWIGSDYAWRLDQPSVMHADSVLRSSWTLRRWADDYCSSRQLLKEFDYDKVRHHFPTIAFLNGALGCLWMEF